MSPQGKEVRDFSKPDDGSVNGVFVTPSGFEVDGNRRMSTTLPMDDAKGTTTYPAFRDGSHLEATCWHIKYIKLIQF